MVNRTFTLQGLTIDEMVDVNWENANAASADYVGMLAWAMHPFNSSLIEVNGQRYRNPTIHQRFNPGEPGALETARHLVEQRFRTRWHHLFLPEGS